jgi:hypothetical protein
VIAAVDVRDQDYVLLLDGSILAVHGELHPEDYVVGELAFVPDLSGSRSLRGSLYSKPYAPDGRGLPEALRPKVRSPGETVVHRADLYKHKSIVHRSQIVEHVRAVPHLDPEILPVGAREYATGVLGFARDWFADELAEVVLGLTGAIRLSSDEDAVLHDLDVVFRARPTDIRGLVGAISRMSEQEASRRVHEHGKSWRIRLNTPAGMLCSFFGYLDASMTPLAGLELMETVATNVIVSGRVVDDTHNATLPTMVVIEPDEANIRLPASARRTLPIFISHLRGRGEFFLGDRGEFIGSLVEVTDRGETYTALSVVDGTSANLLTEPWPGYLRSSPHRAEELGRRRT